MIAFNEIYKWSEKNLGDECIEYIVSMMMEPYDDIINPLLSSMSVDEDKYFSIPTNKNISKNIFLANSDF